MSSFEEIAAQITALRERLLDASSQVDAIAVQFDSDFIPSATATFAGAEGPAAMRALGALSVAYQSAIGCSAAVFTAADELHAYLSEM